MLILCQKKDTIVNLEKVQAINIHLQNRKEVCAWFDVNENNRNSVLLGKYYTEERAKEVLQEILERYHGLKKNTTYAQGDSGFTFNEYYYYEMPKE